jgi:hypothetical protein
MNINRILVIEDNRVLRDADTIDFFRVNKLDASQVLKMSDEQFYQFCIALQSMEKPKVTLTFVNLTTPYLLSKYDAISNFKEGYQLLVAKLRNEIDFLNNDFKQCWFYHVKTFEHLSDANYELVVQNINQIYERIANRSKRAISLIQNIIDY